MANNKISITAEFASIIRSECDPRNLYFVSSRGSRIYNITRVIVPGRKLKEIFDWRLKLSEEFDRKIEEYRPEQIIDLAAGYSLRGLDFCLENPNSIYIDSDLKNVIERKKVILENICREENIVFPKNYFLIPIDVLSDNCFTETKNIINSEKKTLIMAEGLTSYFNQQEFTVFINNIKSFLGYFSQAEFYSHENIAQFKGMVFKVLRSIFVASWIRSRSSHSFSTVEEFKNYLEKLGVNFFVNRTKDGFVFYSLFKK